jgi:hypothetical protein
MEYWLRINPKNSISRFIRSFDKSKGRKLERVTIKKAVQGTAFNFLTAMVISPLTVQLSVDCYVKS